MAGFPKQAFDGIVSAAQKGVSAVKKSAEKIDMDAIKENAAKAGAAIADKAGDVKDAAVAAKEDIDEKIHELDRMLDQAITDYNDAYTLMNDKGVRLFVARSKSVDTINFVENLVNSIANRPKSFETDFEEIHTEKSSFIDTCEFADKELQTARKAAGNAGAGLAAGATVAFMAPTAAMWIATTFGTASTGVAISTLSGAAATNAALAWLGGGALAAGGSGMAGGSALLALAGPVGWGIAGATLLSSIVLIARQRLKQNKQKNEEIESIKKNIETVREMDGQIAVILEETETLRARLNDLYMDCLSMYGADYQAFDTEKKQRLGALVNVTKALSACFVKTVADPQPQESDE